MYQDVKEALLKLANQYGGSLSIDFYDQEAFGNCVSEVQYSSFDFRIVSDRSFIISEFAAVVDHNCWWHFDTITTYIDKNFHFESGSKLLEAIRTFFQTHFGLLVDLFEEGIYADTKRKLEKIENISLL